MIHAYASPDVDDPHVDPRWGKAGKQRIEDAGELYRQSVGNYNWFAYEFWRFVFVQEVVAKFAQSFVDDPPLQAPASFNLDAIKAQVSKAMQAHHGA
jgi:hypothetical protein